VFADQPERGRAIELELGEGGAGLADEGV
jgi:hypothetical protein